MNKKIIHILLLPLLLGFAMPVIAQQSDTTQTKKKLRLGKDLQQPYHHERSPNNFLVPESGGYNVPEPTQYYKPPFTGQKSLDRAVAAYRKELKNSLANTPLFQLLSKIAPFIYTRFEFGVYKINDLPIVDRDNPYLYPQVDNEKQK